MDKNRVLAVMEWSAHLLREEGRPGSSEEEDKARTAVAEVYARVEQLEAELAALREQKPLFYYKPSDDAFVKCGAADPYGTMTVASYESWGKDCGGYLPAFAAPTDLAALRARVDEAASA